LPYIGDGERRATVSNRRPPPFRQSDVTKALRAAKAAGLHVSRFEIDSAGKIVIVSGVDEMATGTTPAAKGERALAEWKAKHHGTA
jgi:hypothetical protein